MQSHTGAVQSGALENAPGRGLRVADLDARYAFQLCDIRRALERNCTQPVAPELRTDPDVAAKLDAALDELRTKKRHEDWNSLNRLDMTFHTTLYNLAGSPLLSALWSGIARHVLILFSIERSKRHNFDRVVKEHERYRSVLMSGTDADIQAEIEKHLMTFRILS